MAIPILFLSPLVALLLGPAPASCDVHHADFGEVPGPHARTYAHRCGGGHSVTVASIDAYDSGTKFGGSVGGASYDYADLFNGTGERTKGGSLTLSFFSADNEAFPDVHVEIRYSRETSPQGPTASGHVFIQLDWVGASKIMNIPLA